ncbi:hypothetical protein A6769_29945 [Nostoc punctiforme NIES-2108]|uniref:Uncharacterized protein n=1 Tax=Nostoc punctiforme NIES-2108 TaxID=1356359 RepID=A0A367R6R2_NOSPU|nr:hypothetical protein A6769_29945 [Nostoc punctiforme NIES-2108]
MQSLSYPPSAYRNLIKMSDNKRLLVEGKEDKHLFRLLLDELYMNKKQEYARIKIDIDSAEKLVSVPNATGNRQKVEILCQSIKNEAYKHKLVGFVDREFREFNISNNIYDNLNIHKVEDQLVWSRGHSIENYFFDFSILRDPLRDLSATEWFNESLTLFEKRIISTIRLACCISLVGKELGKLNLLKDSIDWKVVTITPSNIELLVKKWEECLINKKLKYEEVQKIITLYQYWQPIIENADFQVVRWICHGHIGVAVIWAVYSRCVYHICSKLGSDKPESEVAKVQGIKEGNRTHACASWWARKAMGNQCDYPIEVLKLLGFDLP